MIDYRNGDIESVILKVIASQNFLKPETEAENFESKELSREMNEREKALFTITRQITTEQLFLTDSARDMSERELLGIYFDAFQEAFFKELKKNGTNMSRIIIFCSDEKIYHVSREEFINPCKRCPLYKKCDKRLS